MWQAAPILESITALRVCDISFSLQLTGHLPGSHTANLANLLKLTVKSARQDQCATKGTRSVTILWPNPDALSVAR